MSGGVKNWASGEVLDASDLNDYIANQVISVFDNAAARTAAFGGANPALIEGRFAYLKDTDKLYYYPQGGPWEEVGAEVEDGEIVTTKLADSAVTTAKIADSAITSAKIADGTIVNADVSAAAAIDLGKLADATIDTKSTNYPLVLTDKNKFIKMDSASNRTIGVPLQSTVDFPVGSQIHLIRYGIGTLEVIGESNAVNIYATPGKFLRAQYSSATLLKCDTNTWLLTGDLSAS